MATISVALFEVLSNTVLALRWDKPLRHAEFMFKYSRRAFYIFGIVELWVLRTWLKDLKGEPRTWWGGDKETKVELEKGDEEDNGAEGLKHVVTR
ncbi:hypothetical protein BGZ67_004936 [Mortierella alpina]|nr:hypothetical protein BGZ67_004936 [Mortierella alpina]